MNDISKNIEELDRIASKRKTRRFISILLLLLFMATAIYFLLPLKTNGPAETGIKNLADSVNNDGFKSKDSASRPEPSIDIGNDNEIDGIIISGSNNNTIQK